MDKLEQMNTASSLRQMFYVAVASVVLLLPHAPMSTHAHTYDDDVGSLDTEIVRPSLVRIPDIEVPDDYPDSPSKRDVTGLRKTPQIKERINQLIKGGEEADLQDFKYQAALLINKTGTMYQICGGVLVSPRYMITAAHCLIYFEGAGTTYDHFVLAGAQNLALGLVGNPGSQLIKVANIRIHWQYNATKRGHPNDIAVVQLARDITPSNSIAFATPAPGMFTTKTFDGLDCYVVGWGVTENGRGDELQKGHQYIPSLQTCKNFYAISKNSYISKRQICGFNKTVAPCSGDRGGALTCEFNSVKFVVGILSWGLPGCRTCFPFVYTRLSFYEDWIGNAIAKLEALRM